LKINLGSGYKRIPGFLNVDSDPEVNPDYVVDISKGELPFNDSSVTAVVAHHIFEHIADGFFPLLKELYRVCDSGAIIDVHVPHYRHDYFYGDPTHVRPITIEMINRFSKKNNDVELKGNPGTTPFAYQLGVDFEIVHHEYIIEPFFLEQFKTMENEQVDMMARMYNNVIQEIHFKMMVVK
jgi:predicted SAM-dependent methyltransferase